MNAARLLINHSLRDRKENKESYLKEFLGLVALKIELQSNREKFAKQKDLLFQARIPVVSLKLHCILMLQSDCLSYLYSISRMGAVDRSHLQNGNIFFVLITKFWRNTLMQINNQIPENTKRKTLIAAWCLNSCNNWKVMQNAIQSECKKV